MTQKSLKGLLAPKLQQHFRQHMYHLAHKARNRKSIAAFRTVLSAALTLFLPGPPLAKAFAAELDATTIVQRSIDALRKDWQAEPGYDYREVDVSNRGSKTYRIMMILGSPYKRVEAVNGMPLSPESIKEEQRKLDAAIARRCGESKSQTQRRVAAYNKDQERNHLMMREITRAFTFTAPDETTTNGHDAWHLRALPKPGYQPTSKETKVLTGMEGDLWIDKETFQWIQVEAKVIHPVSIEGFLAKVEPGTRFTLVQAPVAGGSWFPSKFSFGSKVKVLSFIGRDDSEDETYSDYQTADFAKVSVCAAGIRGNHLGNR